MSSPARRRRKPTPNYRQTVASPRSTAKNYPDASPPPWPPEGLGIGPGSRDLETGTVAGSEGRGERMKCSSRFDQVDSPLKKLLLPSIHITYHKYEFI
jgi:hypothetical protein